MRSSCWIRRWLILIVMLGLTMPVGCDISPVPTPIPGESPGLSNSFESEDEEAIGGEEGGGGEESTTPDGTQDTVDSPDAADDSDVDEESTEEDAE